MKLNYPEGFGASSTHAQSVLECTVGKMAEEENHTCEVNPGGTELLEKGEAPENCKEDTPESGEETRSFSALVKQL